MSEQTAQEYLTLTIPAKLPYKWAAGIYVGRFLEELRDNATIYANKCPKCGRYFLPPRIVCGRCHIRTTGWYDVGKTAKIISFTVVIEPFLDPGTGKMKEVPFTFAMLAFEKYPVATTHFLNETNPEKIKEGMRVEAVFKPKKERTGNILDISHFKII